MQIEEEALNTLNNHVQIFYWIMKISETMKINFLKYNRIGVTEKILLLDMVIFSPAFSFSID